MINQACRSLNKFLHDNVEYIKKNNHDNLSILRRTWVDLNPEFKEHDLNLDIVWEGLSGNSSPIYDPQNGFMITCPEPHAKSFKVVVRNWDEEVTVINKMSSMHIGRG